MIILLVTALFVADTTGMIAESDDDIECRDDAGKQCPPTCPSCACAWHTMNTAPAPSFVVVKLLGATHTIDLPPIETVHGRLAPAPIQRPPIV